MVFSKPNRERQKLMREQNILKQVGEAGWAGPGRLGERRAGAALGRLARPPPFTNPTSFLRAVFYPYSVSEWEAPRSRVPRAPARTNTASPVTRGPPHPPPDSALATAREPAQTRPSASPTGRSGLRARAGCCTFCGFGQMHVTRATVSVTQSRFAALRPSPASWQPHSLPSWEARSVGTSQAGLSLSKVPAGFLRVCGARELRTV